MSEELITAEDAGKVKPLEFRGQVLGEFTLGGPLPEFFYSASTGGFYHPRIHPDKAIPADICKVSKKEHELLFRALSEGKVIAPDKDGRPIAVDPLPPPDAPTA